MRGLITLSLLSLCSCIHYRLNEKGTDAQVKHQRVLANPAFAYSDAADACAATGTGLQNVKFTTNWGYALLSSVTLGFVNWVDIEYSCAPQGGKEPMPGP
ncbi:MAG: hypothetical protein JNK82_22750 [Myxococcaceae bacterium]|nr:hypothetical protein [Myxococcaceae bacterium]